MRPAIPGIAFTSSVSYIGDNGTAKYTQEVIDMCLSRLLTSPDPAPSTGYKVFIKRLRLDARSSTPPLTGLVSPYNPGEYKVGVRYSAVRQEVYCDLTGEPYRSGFHAFFAVLHAREYLEFVRKGGGSEDEGNVYGVFEVMLGGKATFGKHIVRMGVHRDCGVYQKMKILREVK
jgi:hypothetical protein